MKIKLLTSIAGVHYSYRRGEVVDMPAEEAQRWLKNGDAELVKDPVESTMLGTAETATAPEQNKKARNSR